jgi:hypothetical protein
LTGASVRWTALTSGEVPPVRGDSIVSVGGRVDEVARSIYTCTHMYEWSAIRDGHTSHIYMHTHTHIYTHTHAYIDILYIIYINICMMDGRKAGRGGNLVSFVRTKGECFFARVGVVTPT